MQTAFGTQLKHWRRVRRMSQLDLSLHAGVGARHLSFLETGRSRPGQDVILRLAEALDVPLRDRNAMLRAAGLGPVYPEGELSDADLAPFRRIVDQMLERHCPYPAFVLDRWWNLVDANPPARMLFLAGRDPSEPVSGLDWLLDPAVRTMVVNWAEIAWHSAHRLRRDVEESGGDAELRALLDRALEALDAVPQPEREVVDNPAICTRVRVGDQELSVVSTIARFGSARAVALGELSVELMFPADSATEAFFQEMFDV